MARPSQWSHAIDLTLFLWHMPADATEGGHWSGTQPGHLESWSSEWRNLGKEGMINQIYHIQLYIYIS